MVREASRRGKKYEAKVDAEVLSRQTTALKPLMVAGQRAYFPAIASLEQKVKTLVEGEGASTLQVRDYLNFGREMYELSNKFQATTLQAEAQLKLNKWSERGLNGSTLVGIARLVGVELEGYEFFYSPFDLIRVGSYYPSFMITSDSYVATGNMMNILRAGLYPLTRKARFNGIGLYCGSVVGTGKARLGVYAMGLNRYPSSLLLDSGEIAFSSMGWKETTIDLTLKKGFYYVAVNVNHNSIVYRNCGSALKGLGAMEYTYLGGWRGFVSSSPFGALPDPYTFPASDNAYIPLIGLKVAEVW